MKRSTLIFALSALLGIGIAVAEVMLGQNGDATRTQAGGEQQHRQPDPAKQVRFLTKHLNLTADQQNQILPVLTNRAQQMEAIRSDSSLELKDRRAKVQALRQDADAKITAVLTADQKQTYEQMRERGRQHRQGTGNQ